MFNTVLVEGRSGPTHSGRIVGYTEITVGPDLSGGRFGNQYNATSPMATRYGTNGAA